MRRPSIEIEVTNDRLARALSTARSTVAPPYRLKRRLFGPPDQIRRRALALVLVASVATVTIGVWYAARSGLDSVSSSSLPILRPVLEVVTSTWVLPIVIAYVSREVVLYRREIEASQAADVTGYSEQSVKRLGEEVKHPDAATRTRVIATSDDTPERILDRILRALEDGEDETLESYREEYRQDVDPIEAEPLEDVADRLVDEIQDVDARINDLEAEVEGELDAIDVEGATTRAAIRNSLDDPGEDADSVTPDEMLSADDRARLRDVEVMVGEIDELEEHRDDLVDELEDVLEDLEITAPSPDENNAALSEEPAADDVDELEDDEADAGDEDRWHEQYKLFKIDLFAALDPEELVWRVGIPAGITIAGLMILVQFWVQPVFYLPILAFGVLVGVLNYLRVERKRSRRLEDLRTETAGVTWSDLAIHVKEVAVPETRIQIARMAGETYAHDDREKFAEEVAARAYHRVNGVDPSPSIMTKQADQLAQYRPDLHGFRDAERERIALWLIERVDASGTGLIPKAKLLEECIEQPVGRGWVPFNGDNAGYDPELVREVYREFVPAALVEQEIPIADEDGAETVTAVRRRGDPVPAEYGEIQAQFSNQFSNYARREPLYELPDVSEKLEADPIYADSIGALAGGEARA